MIALGMRLNCNGTRVALIPAGVDVLKMLNTWELCTNAFVHSFIQAISIAPLQVYYLGSQKVKITKPYNYLFNSFECLLRGAPDIARILCRSFTPKRHRQLRVKDSHKAPTWRLERNSNPRPFGRKVTNLPMSPTNACLKHIQSC